MYFVKYEGDRAKAKVATPKLYIAIIAFLAIATILMVIIPSVFINTAQTSIIAGSGS